MNFEENLKCEFISEFSVIGLFSNNESLSLSNILNFFRDSRIENWPFSQGSWNQWSRDRILWSASVCHIIFYSCPSRGRTASPGWSVYPQFQMIVDFLGPCWPFFGPLIPGKLRSLSVVHFVWVRNLRTNWFRSRWYFWTTNSVFSSKKSQYMTHIIWVILARCMIWLI